MEAEERVVLLNDDGKPTGTARKVEVHHEHTPLHLAFSCHVFDEQGRILMTRRALSKITWPGVWTNSFCGHPGPDETIEAAVRRRATQELGLEISEISPLLPDFRYTAIDASGIVENEVCPVFTARAVSDLTPNPLEIAEHVWADPQAVKVAVLATPWAFSPWFVEQIDALAATQESPWVA